MSRSGKASALAALAASAAAGWARLHARERRLVLLAAAVVLGALLWQLALAPAARTLRQAEGERAALQARWQQMQLLKSEAEALQAMPRLAPGQAQRALQESVEQTLGAAARLSITGDRATLTLKAAPAAALAQWLQQARANARAVPTPARLTRPAGSPPGSAAVWDGSITLALPPA